MTRSLLGVRLVLILVCLGLWFLTQGLLGARPLAADSEAAGAVLTQGDLLLRVTAPWHRALVEQPGLTDGLLIVSSLLIDLLVLFLVLRSLFGESLRPFFGLCLVFALRQVMQAACALPVPEGMLWRDPGFPSLVVTYGVGNDFFFSGHTALAVYGALELARLGRGFSLLAICCVLFEAGVVLVLRAHYTMDVFTGAVVALWIAGLVGRLSPLLDRRLQAFSGANNPG